MAADQTNFGQRADVNVAATPFEESLVRIAAGVHIDTADPSRDERLAATPVLDVGLPAEAKLAPRRAPGASHGFGRQLV